MRVSRQHARFELQEGQWVLTDSHSANGTSVNGKPVTSHALRHGDRIRFGDATFVFVPVADPLATITEAHEEQAASPGGSGLRNGTGRSWPLSEQDAPTSRSPRNSSSAWRPCARTSTESATRPVPADAQSHPPGHRTPSGLSPSLGHALGCGSFGPRSPCRLVIVAPRDEGCSSFTLLRHNSSGGRIGHRAVATSTTLRRNHEHRHTFHPA